MCVATRVPPSMSSMQPLVHRIGTGHASSSADNVENQ
jgi:hypothetical protein